MAEIAGIGKVAVGEGAEIANKSVELIKKSSSVSPTIKATNCSSGSRFKAYGLKLIGKDVWQSPGGVVYGFDKKFGNNFNHVLTGLTQQLKAPSST